MDKKYLFHSWEKRGVIGDYEELYKYYHSVKECEKCNVVLDNSQQLTIKCLDHDHKTRLFRNILCWNCNINEQNRQGCKRRKDNISGVKNISYHKNTDKWCFRRQINKKTLRKYFKSKIDAICYKYILLLKIKSSII
jgi:hypothetical protein